jgi:hypothetical protein
MIFKFHGVEPSSLLGSITFNNVEKSKDKYSTYMLLRHRWGVEA